MNRSLYYVLFVMVLLSTLATQARSETAERYGLCPSAVAYGDESDPVKVVKTHRLAFIVWLSHPERVKEEFTLLCNERTGEIVYVLSLPSEKYPNVFGLDNKLKKVRMKEGDILRVIYLPSISEEPA
jgi:hypothetical protein